MKKEIKEEPETIEETNKKSNIASTILISALLIILAGFIGWKMGTNSSNVFDLKEINQVLARYSHTYNKSKYVNTLIVQNKPYSYKEIKEQNPSHLIDDINLFVVYNKNNDIENYDGIEFTGDQQNIIKYDKKAFEKLYEDFWGEKVPYKELEKLNGEKLNFVVNKDTIESTYDISGRIGNNAFYDQYNIIKVTKEKNKLIVLVDYISIDDNKNVYADIEHEKKIAKDDELEDLYDSNTPREEVVNYLKKYDKEKGKYELTFERNDDTYTWLKTEMVK